jgi:NAD(P)-dependent dehydrogenase (short-subunit alcohol dehydrogenase family)
MSTLNGKVAMVTGAARGIGAGTARALAEQGCRLILTDVDAEPLEALAAELGAERALAQVSDVADLASMEAAVGAGVERFGGIDVLLANAGLGSYGSVMVVDPAAFRRVIDVNLVGVFNTVRAALPSIVERRGYILIVSSMAAFAPAPGMASYSASKAGVLNFADSLRMEVAELGVEIGSAHMSWIDTQLVRDAKDDLPSFRELLASLPRPLGTTLPVEVCAAAFVDACVRRRRRVYVPRWVGALAALRPLLTSTVAERATLRRAPSLRPQMDAEVRALGRFTSARHAGRATAHAADD